MEEWDVRRGALDALVPATGSVAWHGLKLAAFAYLPLLVYGMVVSSDPTVVAHDPFDRRVGTVVGFSTATL